MNTTELEHRVLELEAVAEACLHALALVPVRALQKGFTWHPSEQAVTIIAVAKDRLNDYARIHWGAR